MNEQLSIFDIYEKRPRYQIPQNAKVRLIECFAGIGSQAMSLKTLGVDFEHYRVIEWDRFACQSYSAIHGIEVTPTDIRSVHAKDLGIVDTDKYTYIFCYSFPCTDLSVAGKSKGMSRAEWEQGNATRSGLLWEVERLLTETSMVGAETSLPQILLMENVTQVHSKQNEIDFSYWLQFLENKGYNNFVMDLDAKRYGVPQSRNRCICISILGNYDYKAPEEIPLTMTMNDYLEDEVDEKYYIKNAKAEKLIEELEAKGQLKVEPRQTDRQTDRVTVDLSLTKPKAIDIANCIKARIDAGISNLQSDGSGVCEANRIS